MTVTEVEVFPSGYRLLKETYGGMATGARYWNVMAPGCPHPRYRSSYKAAAMRMLRAYERKDARGGAARNPGEEALG